jgi:proline iminopeptidase
MPGFTWPTIVISGGRDLITPPSVARRVAALIPDSVLVTLPTAGHSIVDFREQAALAIATAICDGTVENLPARAAELDSIPPPVNIRALVWAIDTATRLESVLPAAVPRTMRRVMAS